VNVIAGVKDVIGVWRTMINFYTWLIGVGLFFVLFNIAGLLYIKLFTEKPKKYDKSK